MRLAPGRRLGVYEILTPVGKGGFGEVYRARDTRLDRSVAIKVLPSSDPDLKARFDREARVIASLQHPNICALHDLGRDDGVDYLVFEFLEGDKRFHSAHDLGLQLKWIAGGASDAHVRRRSRAGLAPWAVAGAALLVAIASIVWDRPGRFPASGQPTFPFR